MDLSWKTLLAMSQQHSPVCLGATYDTLPSPSNLHRWHINLEASCLLCKFYYCSCTWSMHCGLATGSLHISSWFYFKCPGSCTKVIYCPVTSSVMLKVIIPSNLWRQLLNCQNIRKSNYRLSNLLTTDWKLLNVLSDKLVFPSVIAITRLRAYYCSILPLRLSTSWNLLALVRKMWKSGTKRISLSMILWPHKLGAMVSQSIFLQYK